MEEQLISFTTAKLAKEKGFNEKCNNTYMYGGSSYKTTPYYFEEKASNSEIESQSYSAPTQSLLQKWIRKNHKINVESNYLPNIQKYRALFVPMNIIPKTYKSASKHYAAVKPYLDTTNYDSYEEALEAGIIKALELITKQHENKE